MKCSCTPRAYAQESSARPVKLRAVVAHDHCRQLADLRDALEDADDAEARE